MNNRMLPLCGVFWMLIAAIAPAAALSYEYTCEGEVDGKRRGLKTLPMYKGSDGKFTGVLGNLELEARQEGEVLVMAFLLVQRPDQPRVKRTHVPTGKDNPAKFETRLKSGLWSIVCR
jgi:hypothetical protein